MDSVLYEGRDKLRRRGHKLIQQMLDRYKLGADVTGVTMQSRAAAPEQVAAAFEETVKARQDRARATQRSAGLCRRHHPAGQGQGRRA